MPSQAEFKDKFIGTFIGLALGDALGAPYEGGFIERFLWRFFSKTPTGKMRWTDDTQMSIDLAESILEKNTVDQNHLALKFASSYKWSRGYGPAASKVLKSIKKGINWKVANRQTYKDGSLGNGGAMRSPILALIYSQNNDLLTKEITKATQITHAHPLAIEGAVLVGKAVSLALNNIDSLEIITIILQHSKTEIFKKKVELSLKWWEDNLDISPKDVSKNLGNGIKAADSCITAIYLGLRFRSKSFNELIKFTRKCGGDVDTLCSMSGSIWGAFNGFKNIPKELFDDLEDGNRIKSLACNLYKTKIQISEKIN